MPTAPVSAMDALGELICRLNPYTERTDPASHRHTGKMDVYLAPNHPPVPNPSNPTGAPADANAYAQIELEVDAKYASEWAFKGQPQRINTAFRIRYRYPVFASKGDAADPSKALYWVDDYILIGYEGAGGV